MCITKKDSTPTVYLLETKNNEKTTSNTPEIKFNSIETEWKANHIILESAMIGIYPIPANPIESKIIRIPQRRWFRRKTNMYTSANKTLYNINM